MDSSQPQPVKIYIEAGTRINPPVYIHSPVNIGMYNVLQNCSIGAFSYTSHFCEITSVEIGRYCQIGTHVTLLQPHPQDRLTTHPCSYLDLFPEPYTCAEKASFTAPAAGRIGNDVWIGNDAKIMCGVNIGDGAIIGAGAIVTKDVPPFAVVVGTPAKVIRQRFPDALIEKILASQWWDYDITSAPLDWSAPEATLDAIHQHADRGTIRRHEMVFSVIDTPRQF